MGKPTLPKGQELALIIKTEGNPLARTHWDYFHVFAVPAIVNRDDTVRQDTPKGDLSFPSRYSSASELDGFRVYSQGGADDEPRRLYAWHCEYYGKHSFELAEIEEMAKLLKSLLRALKKADERDGYAQTFGQYVGRVAHALGARWMLFSPPDRQPRWCNGYAYCADKIGDGIGRIDRLVDEWVNALKKDEYSAA